MAIKITQGGLYFSMLNYTERTLQQRYCTPRGDFEMDHELAIKRIGESSLKSASEKVSDLDLKGRLKAVGDAESIGEAWDLSSKFFNEVLDYCRYTITPYVSLQTIVEIPLRTLAGILGPIAAAPFSVGIFAVHELSILFFNREEASEKLYSTSWQRLKPFVTDAALFITTVALACFSLIPVVVFGALIGSRPVQTYFLSREERFEYTVEQEFRREGFDVVFEVGDRDLYELRREFRERRDLKEIEAQDVRLPNIDEVKNWLAFYTRLDNALTTAFPELTIG